MKPNEIDVFVKDRLEKEHSLYQSEISQAKPLVWASLQQNLNKSTRPRWYQIAAVFLLLFLTGLGLVFHSIQQQYQKELNQLVERVNQYEKVNQATMKDLESKDREIAVLKNNLENSARKQAPADEQINVKPKIVYLKDTIHIKSIIQPTVPPTIQKPLLVEQKQEVFIDEMIYPDYSGQKRSNNTETIKLRFGTFTARNN